MSKLFFVLPIAFISSLAMAKVKSETIQFAPVYTDVSNGLHWSAALPGFYFNGCVNASHTGWDVTKCTFDVNPDGTHSVSLADSDAAQACVAIGARLPTGEEYRSLIQQFDFTTLAPPYTYLGPQLTPKGIADMNLIFGDMMTYPRAFWSSSVAQNGPGQAQAFLLDNGSGTDGGSVGLYARGANVLVRCVSAK